ncbi:MAG: transposase [Thermomicrobiales bacterium]
MPPSDQRTRLDFAHCVQELVDAHSPRADQIVLVLDQLNIHSPASLYAAFPPAEARRLTEKIKTHYTPKHGNWLNMAELELSVLERQCLLQRLADRAAMERAVFAWTARRNAATATIDWHFTITDARTKLRRLCPAFES